MTAAIFGLLGVIVGAVLNAGLTALNDRSKAKSLALVASCLLRDELRVTDDRVRGALELGRWGPVLDPGLPYSSGLWAVEQRGGTRGKSVWPDSRKDLAPYLLRSWSSLAEPFHLVDDLSVRFWTNEPDRRLTEDECLAFKELRIAIAKATMVLDDFTGTMSAKTVGGSRT
jgi:hypothetical protein